MKKAQLNILSNLVARIYWNQLFLIGKAKAYFYRGDIVQLDIDALYQKLSMLNTISGILPQTTETTASQDVDILTAVGSIIYDFESYCFDDNVGTIGVIANGWPKRDELRQLLTQIRKFLFGHGLTDNHPIYKTPCYPELNPDKLTPHTTDTIQKGDMVVTAHSNMRLLVLSVDGTHTTVTALSRELGRIKRMTMPINFTYQTNFFGVEK